MKARIKKICEYCKNEFETNLSKQIYCSFKCRDEVTKAKLELIREQNKDNINVNIANWSRLEHEHLKAYFKEGLSFKDMTERINKLRESKSENGSYIIRTPRSVYIQLYRLNLISPEDFAKLELESLQRWEEKKKETARKRDVNLDTCKKNILNRDNSQCVICKSKDDLIFAHVIPFRQTSMNTEKESITLCNKHHKAFDNLDNDITKKVFEIMSSYYEDYSKDYCLYETLCLVHGNHLHIKRVGQNPSQIIEQEKDTSKG